MTPGPPALCEGSVVHRRSSPERHEFTSPVSQVWIDPDDPGALCGLHPAWSHHRPALARFRRADYGTTGHGSLAQAARDDVGTVLGRTPTGPVRMLSQIRRWGWLFNPITVFLVWDHSNTERPVGAVLEVTNTPWKERTRYPLALDVDDGRLTTEFAKTMHVSPFLGMEYRYRLDVRDRDDRIAIDLDVIDAESNVVVHTALRLRREPATRETLARSLWSTPMPTHRVSAGIHRQAARLWSKGIPFVTHPGKTESQRTTVSPPTTISQPTTGLIRTTEHVR